MGEETLGDGGRSFSLVPSSIFLIVAIIQLLDGFVARIKKQEFRSSEEYQLRQEIKQLLKEATLLSTPSTFAQAAKLRRAAATKEKELLKIQEEHREKRVSSDLHGRALMIMKAIIYIGLSWWFWGVPVAVVPQKLLQPFGKFLSWKAGDSATGLIAVGILPWLVLTTRVSKFLSQRLPSFMPQ